MPGRRGGAGVGAHRRGARRAARRARPRRRRACPAARRRPARCALHVDRSFTLRGIGTVVTGTLWSGSAGRGDAVAILPRGPAGARPRRAGARRAGRARRGGPAGRAEPRRASGATRWGAATWSSAAPGAAGRAGVTSRRRGARVGRRRAARRGARVHVHHGTREAPARVAELGGGYAQLRLEPPLVPAAGDRLVIRPLAPPDTIGGGVVVDPAPRAPRAVARAAARLARLERGEPEPGADVEPAPRAGARAPAPLDAAPRSPSRTSCAPPAHEPPLDAELEAADELAALREAGRAVRLGRRCTSTPSRWRGARARRRALRARGRDHDRRACATSSALAQVRPGAARAPRRREVTLRRGDVRVLRRRR